MGSTLRDRVSMTVSGTPGTGAVTLGSAQSGYQTAAASGVQDGEINTWVFKDGSAWEISSCVYTASGTSLARTLISSSTGSLLSLSVNTTCFIDSSSQDYGNSIIGQFGDGSDGNVTISGSVTLTRDMYYNNLTITTGAALNTSNFRIFWRGILDITSAPAGGIFSNGSAGGNAASTSSGGSAGTAAYTSSTGTILKNCRDGTSGNAGQTGLGTNGGPAVVDGFTYGGVTGISGAGGAGVSAGGTAGTVAAATYPGFVLTVGPIAPFTSAGGAWSSSVAPGDPGNTGGSGGGDATNRGGACGGGGGSGGAVFLCGNIVNRGGSTAAGCIQAKGGDAGLGFTPTVGNVGGAGGSTGGGGGLVVLAARLFVGSPAANAIDVSGGNGAAGTAGHGSPGVGGDGGASGQGGRIDIFNLASGNVLVTTPTASVAGTAHSGINGGAGATATVSRATL